MQAEMPTAGSMGVELVAGPQHRAITFTVADQEDGPSAAPLSIDDGRMPPGPRPKLLPSFSRPPDLNLPPGVAPVSDHISMFCSVSAFAVSLLIVSGILSF